MDGSTEDQDQVQFPLPPTCLRVPFYPSLQPLPAARLACFDYMAAWTLELPALSR